jgi:hypothetical protein
MSKKTISKVIIYYEDGTYEEVKAGLSHVQNKQDKSPVAPNPIDYRPDWKKVQEWQEQHTIPRPTWVAPNTAQPWPGSRTGDIYCDSNNSTLQYKYSITSTGNGNVDISK